MPGNRAPELRRLRQAAARLGGLSTPPAADSFWRQRCPPAPMKASLSPHASRGVGPHSWRHEGAASRCTPPRIPGPRQGDRADAPGSQERLAPAGLGHAGRATLTLARPASSTLPRPWRPHVLHSSWPKPRPRLCPRGLSTASGNQCDIRRMGGSRKTKRTWAPCANGLRRRESSGCCGGTREENSGRV